MVVERALDILEAVQRYGGEVGLSELANIAGLRVGATRRFASILVKRGYLYQKRKRGKYSLGLKLLQFRGAINVAINIKEQAFPFLKKFSDEVSETVVLSVLEEVAAVDIATVVPKHVLQVNPVLDILNTFPLHCTSVGKILIANMSDARIEHIMRTLGLIAYTDRTITDETQFKKKIETIRRDGIAFDDEEYITGVRSAAAPVKGENGEVLASVAFVAPSARMSISKIRQLAPTLKSYALQISRSLGYNGE